MVAVNLINNGSNWNHPQQSIIMEARVLIQRTGTTINHIYRGANECTDHLARINASLREFLLRDRLAPRSYTPLRHNLVDYRYDIPTIH